MERKEVTILDMVSWIAANPGTSYNKQHEDTGFNENTYQEKKPLAGADVKLTSQIIIERFVMPMSF
jgi:hypothetical protein